MSAGASAVPIPSATPSYEAEAGSASTSIPEDNNTLASPPSVSSRDAETSKGFASEPGEVEKGAENPLPVVEPESPGPPPEGGLRAWLTVFGSFIMMFCSFGFTNSWGVLQNYYATHQFSEESPSTIAWIGSLQLWAMFTLGIVSGPLYDRGYFRSLLIVGSVLDVFCLFMVSLCKEFWQALLCQGLGQGFAMGLLFLPSISVLSQYFARRRALAMGIAVVGSSAGGICVPIFLTRMLAAQPFDAAIRALAYMVLALLVLANVIMSPRLPPKPKGAPRPPAVSPRTIFREPRYVLSVLGAFFVAMGLFMPFFFIEIFLEVNRVSPTLSRYSLAVLNGASVFGRTIPNALADRYGCFNMLIPVCGLTSVLLWAMFGATNLVGGIFFLVLYGFASGGYVSLVGPTFASMSNSFGEIGIRMGLAFVIIGLAALAGSPIAGALLVRTPNFSGPIIFSGVCVATGTSLFILARREQVKIKGTQKV